MNKPRVTLRDIAKKLGVDHSTVSLALKNHPRISAAMRARVQAAAREMGYTPDPMLAALSRYRQSQADVQFQGEIAWFNNYPDPAQLRRYHEFDQYWLGAEEVAQKNGYRLQEYTWRAPDDLARIAKILRARNVRGILVPPHLTPPDWGDFAWEHFSVVRYGYGVTNLPVDVVTNEQVGSCILAVEKIRELGYRRLGFITRIGGKGRHLFHGGFLQAQVSFEPKEQVVPLLLGLENPTEDQRAFSAWMKKHRPDALLSGLAALPAMLEKAGLRIPQDVAFATLSIHDGNADTGIDQHPMDIGRFGMERRMTAAPSVPSTTCASSRRTCCCSATRTTATRSRRSSRTSTIITAACPQSAASA